MTTSDGQRDASADRAASRAASAASSAAAMSSRRAGGGDVSRARGCRDRKWRQRPRRGLFSDQGRQGRARGHFGRANTGRLGSDFGDDGESPRGIGGGREALFEESARQRLVLLRIRLAFGEDRRRVLGPQRFDEGRDRLQGGAVAGPARRELGGLGRAARRACCGARRPEEVDRPRGGDRRAPVLRERRVVGIGLEELLRREALLLELEREDRDGVVRREETDVRKERRPEGRFGQGLRRASLFRLGQGPFDSGRACGRERSGLGESQGLPLGAPGRSRAARARTASMAAFGFIPGPRPNSCGRR